MLLARSYVLRSLIAVAVVSSLPLILYTAYSLYRSAEQTELNAFSSLKVSADLSAQRLDGAIGRVAKVAARLAELPELRSPNQERCSRFLRTLVESGFVAAEVGAFDLEGRPRCLANTLFAPEAADATGSAWFKELRQRGEGEITSPFAVDGKPGRYVAVGSYALGPDGSRVGMIAVILDAERIARLLKNEARPLPGLESLLMDASGTVIAREPFDVNWVGRKIPESVRVEARDDSIHVSRTESGQSVVIVASPLKSLGLEILVSAPEGSIYTEGRSQSRVAFLAAVAAIALGAWATWLLARRLLAPTVSLLRTVRELSAGNSQARASQKLPAEFNEFGAEFNRLIDAHQASEADLKIARQQAQRMGGFYKALSYANQAAIRATVPEELFKQICEGCVTHGRVAMAWVGSVEDNGIRPIACDEASTRAYIEGLNIQWDPLDESTWGPIARTVLSGRTWVTNDFRADPITSRWRDRAAPFDVNASAAIPILRSGKLCATLNIYLRAPEVFDKELLELFEQLAANAAFTLDKFESDKTRNKALREMELGYERFRRIFDLLPLPSVIVRVNNPIILDANEAFGRQAGFQPEHVAGRRARDLGIGPAPALVTAMIQEVIEKGPVRNRRMTMATRSGSPREILVNLEPFDFMGEQAILVINTDITDIVTLDAKLKEREQQLSGIVENAMDAIITVDADGKIVVFNQAASTMFGVAASQMIGQPLDRLLPNRFRAAHTEHILTFREGGGRARTMGESRQLVGIRADGEEFPIQATISRVGTQSAALMTVVARDVTKVLQAEQAWRTATEAEASNRAKSEFLSRVSHELRTPLNAVTGFTRLMRDDASVPVTETQRSRLDLVLHAATQLQALLDDILDLSRIEARAIRLDPVTLDLREILENVVRMSETSAIDNSITLIPNYSDKGPTYIQADAVRLRQVLLNLISNGIKYNRPGGEVKISIEREPHLVHIKVEDNGLGMSPEQQAGLFQPFNRLGREHSGIEGTGIGLALSRQLVDLMGGEIRLVSTVDVGTCFRVTLPSQDITPSEAPTDSHWQQEVEADAEASPSGVVLCIEDNEVNLMLIEQLMMRWPEVKLATAQDGSSGIASAAELQPDVVLLDMNLPDMSGLEVLARLRSQASTSDLVVVALSASAMPEDVKAAKAAGARDYWTKPIDFEQFFGGLRELLSHKRPGPEPLH